MRSCSSEQAGLVGRAGGSELVSAAGSGAARTAGLARRGRRPDPTRLLAAYERGVFPWYSAQQPILWWSPDPRMVLFPDEFKCSRSLAKPSQRPSRHPRRSPPSAPPSAAAPRPAALRSRHLAERGDDRLLRAVARTGVRPFDRDLPRATSWLGACTASSWDKCFSANRCSAGSAMPPRSHCPFGR
jgi:hypothetical protein